MGGTAHLGATSPFIFQFFLSCSPCLPTKISSAVGAPWRCGVVTTWGRIAGFGLSDLSWGRARFDSPKWGGGSSRKKLNVPRLCCCCFSLIFSRMCMSTSPRNSLSNPESGCRSPLTAPALQRVKLVECPKSRLIRLIRRASHDPPPPSSTPHLRLPPTSS